MKDIFWIVLIWALGINVGFLLGVWWRTRSIINAHAGYLKVDHSIPGELNFFADLDMPVEQIQNKAYVVFEVKNVQYLKDDTDDKQCQN